MRFRHQCDHALVAFALMAAGYFAARCHRHHHQLARSHP